MILRLVCCLGMLFFGSCDLFSTHYGKTCYRTEHFKIYYHEDEFTPQEIKQIGARKEYLRKYINNTLETHFDGVIDVYLDWYLGENPNAEYTVGVFESRRYVMDDDGHEIAHIMVFETLGGDCDYDVMTEGMAVSLEYVDFSENATGGNYQNALEMYARIMSMPDTSEEENELDWYKCDTSITSQFYDRYFDYSSGSYLRAGAFLIYLRSHWGIKKVKQLYGELMQYTSSEKIDQTFKELFGATLPELEMEFTRLYVTEERKKNQAGSK
ncbi:MAG: hypothetical protein HQK83_18750 [Fibrobacteria bacterium]|nr:hypothetical protein [Fibrobacteria bacterium]